MVRVHVRPLVDVPAARPVAAATWLFTPVAAALLCAAIVGLPLFQDGSSYLFELLVTGSAIRHHRLSALLVQLPGGTLDALLASLHVEATRRLPWVRTAFTLAYAMVPLAAIGLSWLVVGRRSPALVVWPALIVLFVGLVNFSGVSELWIAIQLCCPLLLVSILAPGTRRHLVLAIVLLPIVVVLHPLAAPVLGAVAVATALAGRHDVGRRRAALASAGLYLVAALLRGVMSVFLATDHEAGFLAAGQMTEYLFLTRWENVVFLLGACAIAVVCARGRALVTSERGLTRLYVACMVLAAGTAALLLSQYVFDARDVPLKVGPALFVAMLLMVLAASDAIAPPAEREGVLRMRLVTVLALVFAAVVGGKALMWKAAVQRLSRTLSASDAACVERDSAALAWLRDAPYRIIDNWALPSLALVTRDSHPATLLLEPGDCRRFVESGMVQVDPWTTLPVDVIEPALGPLPRPPRSAGRS